MKEKLLLLLLMGITVVCLALPTAEFLQEQEISYTDNQIINELLSNSSTSQINYAIDCLQLLLHQLIFGWKAVRSY